MRNRVQLIGNLGNAPEVKEFGKNGRLAKVSMATNERYKNAKGEYVTETMWHNLVIWGKLAETAEKYFTKGQEVAVEGKLVNRSYEKDGEKKYITEIKVENFIFLGGNKE